MRVAHLAHGAAAAGARQGKECCWIHVNCEVALAQHHLMTIRPMVNHQLPSFSLLLHETLHVPSVITYVSRAPTGAVCSERDYGDNKLYVLGLGYNTDNDKMHNISCARGKSAKPDYGAGRPLQHGAMPCGACAG